MDLPRIQTPTRLIPAAHQPDTNYRLWTPFSMPVGDGKRDAIAVQRQVAILVNSAYALLLTWIVVNVWCICLAIGASKFLARKKPTVLVTSIWNKRSSFSESLLELFTTVKKRHWRGWTIYGAIFVVVCCLALQITLSVFIPLQLFVGSAAPVNPDSVIVLPPPDASNPAELAHQFSLDVAAALRAAGGARGAPDKLHQLVNVSSTPLGNTDNGEPVVRIEYSYNVTGADLGLQHYSALRLNVDGACTTEYSWLVESKVIHGSNRNYSRDAYNIFGMDVSLSHVDSGGPIPFFYIEENPNPSSNKTWAVAISSVDRLSFSNGDDPIYLTDPAPSVYETAYIVKPGRPVLSCWQSDIWTYKGKTAAIYELGDLAVSGVELPEALCDLLQHYHTVPRILSLGQQLASRALQSSSTSLGSIFDAEHASIKGDFDHLVLAAYIATANTLNEATIYPEYLTSSSSSDSNLAKGPDGTPKPGTGDFVVFTPDVSALSTRILILLPSLAVGMWLIMLGVLHFGPVKIVNGLDASVLHRTLVETHPRARPTGHSTDSWVLDVPEGPQEESLLHSDGEASPKHVLKELPQVQIRPMEPFEYMYSGDMFDGDTTRTREQA